MTSEWPKHQVDHKNLNPSDNRLENLRGGATDSLNRANTENRANTDLNAKNTSGRKGVCWAKRVRKWKAAIQANGKTYFLGHFDNPVDAHRAYVIAAIKHFGEFARTWSREDELWAKDLLNKIMHPKSEVDARRFKSTSEYPKKAAAT
jgi:HNH endonuclease